MFTNNTYVKSIETPDGFAVFASKDTKKGEVIEEFIFRQCPWRSLDLDTRVGFLHQTAMMRNCSCTSCRQLGSAFLLMGGNASVYTHANEPNAKIDLPDEGTTPVNIMLQGIIVASEDIKKDEEITINHTLHYTTQKQDAGIMLQKQQQQMAKMEQAQQAMQAQAVQNVAPAEATADM